MSQAEDDYARQLAEELARRDAEVSAIKAEFERTVGDDLSDPAVIEEHIKRLVPEAVQTLRLMLIAGESESVKLNAAKFVLGVGLGKIAAVQNPDDEAFKKLLEDIK